MAHRSHLTVFARLLSLLGPLGFVMLTAILFGILGHAAAILMSIAGAKGLLVGLGIDHSMSLSLCLGLLLGCGFARGPLRYAEQMANHYIAFRILAQIRDRVYLKLRTLAPAKLEAKNKGDLIFLITSDIELLEVFYAHTISPVAIALVLGVLMLLYIGHFSWILAGLAGISYLIVGYVIPRVATHFGGSTAREHRAQAAGISGFILDSLRGLGEILQFNRGAERLEAIDAHTDALAGPERRMKAQSARSLSVVNAAIIALNLIFLATAVSLHLHGFLSLTQTLIPFVALVSSYGPFIAIANLGNTLQSTTAAANRVLDILDEAPLVREVTGQEEVPFSGALVRGVNFSYGPEEVLHNVELPLAPGETIGIRGRSGSGKSTLLRLLMRFWTVDRGEISISGRRLDQINTSNLRAMQSLVEQETHLFHDSIRANIQLARPDATAHEVEEAARKASIHSFISSLPQGYDTPVGELGNTLSGGERQRIGLARAFLHDAPLMLMDEPTSNLDSLNEAVILQSVRREAQGKTILIVSHRPSTLRIAGKEYEMTAGKLRKLRDNKPTRT